jgi:hypothetical protein
MFLSSSGNIIEARLTRKGREALANGTFKITQFALSDDGVNYNLYDTTLGDNADQDILALPVLEANTNDNAALQNLLITMDEGTQTVTFITVNGTPAITSTNKTCTLFVKTNNVDNISETYTVIDVTNQTLWDQNIKILPPTSSGGGVNMTFTYSDYANLSSDVSFTFRIQGQSSGVQSEPITMTVGQYIVATPVAN